MLIWGYYYVSQTRDLKAPTDTGQGVIYSWECLTSKFLGLVYPSWSHWPPGSLSKMDDITYSAGISNAWYMVGVSEMFAAWVKDSDPDPWYSHSWQNLLQSIRLDHTMHENPHCAVSATGKWNPVWPLFGGKVVCISKILNGCELWWVIKRERQA